MSIFYFSLFEDKLWKKKVWFNEFYVLTCLKISFVSCEVGREKWTGVRSLVKEPSISNGTISSYVLIPAVELIDCCPESLNYK